LEAQQLATKVTQLESRVATLEDEGKIVKGEVKQILTEIRTAILVRDNPFEADGGGSVNAGPISIVQSPPIAKLELVPPSEHAAEPISAAAATPAPDPAPRPAPALQPEPEPQAQPTKEPVMLRPLQPVAIDEPVKPQWTLLTIASLSGWAEEAMRRLGALRLEILLDLCEAAGHITPDARTALARVTELDIPEPEQQPSSTETAAILRQLDALVNDESDFVHGRHRRAA
jgi:hypothetical protein